MATMLQGPAVPAETVGNAFVHQYYIILHRNPELVHRFYLEGSKLGRPEENGVMTITTTMQAINDKIVSLQTGNFTVEISTIDSQDSYNGGVLVLVTGYLTKANMRRQFTQSFFLAPQENGYYVLNDVLRYADHAQDQNEYYSPVNEVVVPPQHQDPSPVLENCVTEQPADSSQVVNGWDDYEPSESVVAIQKEEAPIPEAVSETPDNFKMVSESNSKVDDTPKKSYASIVKVFKEGTTLVTPVPTSSKSTVKSLEQQVATLPPPPTTVADPLISDENTAENGNNEENDVEGPSIYLKGLPDNVTISLVENEFKKFGTIRSNGIQIRNQKGFIFGFVEFEEATAVQNALEASPVILSGRRVVVEGKRSTYRANRGRSSSGPVSRYVNDNGRGGRGNYGNGRGYGNRGDNFGNRSDFANRGGGGHSNRRGGDRDGYQRVDGANGGGRVNRPGGYAVNATAAKGMAPQVSASA
ncbi:hypothetical protein ACFE04_029282 [Oxalis oulophora]